MAAPERPKMDCSNFSFPTPSLAQPSAAISPAQPSAAISPAQPSDAISPAQPSSAMSPAQPSAAISPSQPPAAISPAQPSATISPAQPSDAISPAQPSDAIYRAQPSSAMSPAQPSAAISPSQPPAAISPAQPSDAISPAQPSDAISPAQPSDAMSPAQLSDAISPARSSSAISSAQPSAASSPAQPSSAISPAQPSAAISPAQTSAAISPAAAVSSAQATHPIKSPVSAGPSAPSSSRLSKHLLYKNRLQEYAQRSSSALPMYQTINEGLSHAPRFRSTVWVDGMSYTSQNTFSHRKAAEQDVAMRALECLSKKIRDEGLRFILENALFCKCILYEYAVKLNQEIPPYDTVKREALVPLFISSLVFNGKRYTGHPGRNKKEAEQLAARDAILSILGNPESGTLLPEIIRSKAKLSAAIKNAKGSQDVDTSTVSPIANKDVDTSTVSPIANKGHTSVGAAPVAANNIEMQAALPECSYGVLPPEQEFQLPKQVISPEVSKLPNVSLQAGLEQHVDDSSSLKRRKKNKKKANKKSRLDSLSPVAALPLNEVPPCSVSVAQ